MFRAVTSVAAFFVLRRRRCVVGDAVFHSRHGAWPAVPEQEQPCVSFIFSCLQDTIILVTGKKLSSSTEKSGRETPEDVLCSKVPKLGDHAWTVTRIMKTAGEGSPLPCLMPGSQLAFWPAGKSWMAVCLLLTGGPRQGEHGPAYSGMLKKTGKGQKEVLFLKGNYAADTRLRQKSLWKTHGRAQKENISKFVCLFSMLIE